jgi:hypothetical protein
MHYACSVSFFFNLSLAYAASTKRYVLPGKGILLPAEGMHYACSAKGMSCPDRAKGVFVHPFGIETQT